MQKSFRWSGMGAALGALGFVWACATASDPGERAVAGTSVSGSSLSHGWTTAVEPKALSDQVAKGLDWIVAHQLESGGWGQGEESAQMGNSLEHLVEKANVADTCMAALALVRSGATPGEGARGGALANGVRYVCAQIEESDEDSLYVTDVRGTRVQMKIGTYIDTFLASMLLSEVKGATGDEALDGRVDRALAKVLAKIEKNQADHGGFENSGWAPVLAQSMASKGMNRALQVGASLDWNANLENNEYFLAMAEGTLDQAVGEPEPLDVLSGGELSTIELIGPMDSIGGAGTAGVSLYGYAANLGGLQDFVNSSVRREAELDELIATSGDEGEVAAAKDEKGRLDRARKVQRDQQLAVVRQLEDPAFVSGFGSNGGEEFLSYMNISESLVVSGDEAWQRWDAAVTDNLNRVQNGDGSWTGHHCITGRTFVTSAALLTLMADRTPVPVELVATDE